MDRECANCAELSDCHEVTERMLANHDYCSMFAPADEGVLAARADIIRECGLRALRYEIPHRKQMSAKRKSRRRRQHV